MGSDKVYKCIDMALTNLKKGTHATVSCPSKLVFGSAEVQAPLGDETIPKNSDVVFDLEVLDCNKMPLK